MARHGSQSVKNIPVTKFCMKRSRTNDAQLEHNDADNRMENEGVIESYGVFGDPNHFH